MRPLAEGIKCFLSNPDFARRYEISPRVDRAGMLASLKMACDDLIAGKKCDLCETKAAFVKPVYRDMDESERAIMQADPRKKSLFTVAVLCPACNAFPDAVLHEKVFAGLEEARPRGIRTAIMGRPVGGARNLMPREAVDTCCECGAAIWIDEDAREEIGEGHQLLGMCPDCAQSRYAAGKLHAFPVFPSP
jgi:hypothetical protein